MDEDLMDCFGPKFKEHLEDLKEEDYEEYQESIKIINDDKDPTLEEIDQMLKEAEEDEKENREFYNQLKETSKQLDKLNNWLDKRYEELGLNTTFEAVREAGYREIVKDEKYSAEDEEKFIKEYRKINEENRKFLEENDLPYIEISGEDIKK